METRKTFIDQPVRLLVRNPEGNDLVDVRFRADIAARLDPGMPGAGIPARWMGSVKHDGRSFIVALRNNGTEDVWFHADILDDEEEEEDDD